MNIVAFHHALSLCMRVGFNTRMGKKTNVSAMKWVTNQLVPTLEHKIPQIGMAAF